MRVLLISGIVALVLLFSAKSQADLSNLFDNIRSNHTSASSTSNGRSNGISLGGYSMRNKISNAPIVSFRPPSLNAGCNGVDFFAGSFSIISKDQIVQTMRGIAQGAATYAFGLAIDSLCATCAQNMKDLQEKLDEINKWSIDSCKASQDLVDGGIAKTKELVADWKGTSAETKNNATSDRGESITDGKDPIESLVEAGLESDENISFNAIWHLINVTNVYEEFAQLIYATNGSSPSSREQYYAKLILMNFLGAPTQTYTGDADETLDFETQAPTVGVKQLLNEHLTEGSEFYVCKEGSTTVDCAEIENKPEMIEKVKLDETMAYQISVQLLDIQDNELEGGVFKKILNRDLCNGNSSCPELEILRDSEYQVLRLVEQFAMNNDPDLSSLKSLADVVALEVSFKRLTSIIDLMNDMVDKFEVQKEQMDFKLAQSLMGQLKKVLKLAKDRMNRDKADIVDLLEKSKKPIDLFVLRMNKELRDKTQIRDRFIKQYGGR